MGKMKNQMWDEMDYDEYEAMFPAVQEFDAWVNCIERDYKEELKSAKLAVTNKVVLFADGEELSPFATVNS